MSIHLSGTMHTFKEEQTETLMAGKQDVFGALSMHGMDKIAQVGGPSGILFFSPPVFPSLAYVACWLSNSSPCLLVCMLHAGKLE